MHRLALALLLAGCVESAKGTPQATPAFYADNTKGYANTVAGQPAEIAFGWDLRIDGDVARWRECTAKDVCGGVERKRPVKELLAKKRAAEADVDGRRVEVLELSLEPRPGYVVPAFKP